MRIMAIVMLAAGILALAYGGFSYTRQTHEAKVGPLEFSLSENRRFNVPIWAGVALAVVGGGLLLSGTK
jgi:TRAP-type C4-dicarboxylate transport system permease small subunit